MNLQKLSFLCLWPLLVNLMVIQPAARIPVTGAPLAAALHEEAAPLPTLDDFTASLEPAQDGQITGLYVENKLAYPVVQQPAGDAGFVSSLPDTLTEFALARQFGGRGILAHNHLAGASFEQLAAGDVLVVILSGGQQQYYQIDGVQRYQALSPTSPQSNFRSLADDSLLTSSQLFHQTYGAGGGLVLQTCIAQGSELSWGRLFLLASPIPAPAETTNMAWDRFNLADYIVLTQ